MEQPGTVVFEPQIWTRDRDDTRLAIVLHTLSFLMTILLWIGFNYGLWWLCSTWTGSIPLAVSVIGGFNYLLGTFFTAWGSRIMVNRLRLTEEGIHIERETTTQPVSWEDIEQIESLSRWDMIKLYFSPHTGRRLSRWKLAIPFSFTFTHYVRIRHKTGLIVFPPQNRSTFLRAVRQWMEIKQADQAGQSEEATKPTPWYVNTSTETDEGQQTVHTQTKN